MDTLAGATMPPLPDPTGRSFALLDQAERDRLGSLLRPLAWIDGLITAMVVAPEAPDEADEVEGALDWLDLIWNEEKEDEIGKLTLQQSAELVEPVMAHYVHIAESLVAESETYRPYLAGFSDPLEAAAQWAAGFCGGLSLKVEAWTPLFADEDARSLLVAVFSLVHDEDLPEDRRTDSPFRAMPPERLERMRRSAVEMLPDIVLALHDHALGQIVDDDFDPDEEDDLAEAGLGDPQEPYVRATPKVGRNAPCPCGSGKKYKNCCLE